MAEGVRPNELGLYEVFHGGEMIARVRGQKEARDIYNDAYQWTMGTIHDLRDKLELDPPRTTQQEQS